MSFKPSTSSLVRASSRHPWVVIGLWVVLLVVSVTLIAKLLGGALTTEVKFTNNPESRRADTLLEKCLTGPRKASDVVIIRSDTLTVDAPAFRSYVEGLYSGIMGLGGDTVAMGINYYQFSDPSLVSADRHTTIMPLVIGGAISDITDKIDKVHEVIARDQNSSFRVLTTGEATMSKDFQKVAEKDLRKAEIFGVAIALVILVLVFGAVVAASIPLIMGLVSILVALGATSLVGQFVELNFTVTNMITMMGLAVGIDYSLFIISRYREERRRGLEKMDAIGVAGATANRTVFFSGIMVVTALIGMLIVPLTVFHSLGAGAILTVIVTVLAAQTLLPALLSLIGDRVNSLRIPFLQRKTTATTPEQKGGFWNWVSHTVMQRPVISLALALAILVTAAVPLLGIRTGASGVSTLPDSVPSKEGFLILNQEFSAGLVTPAKIVIDGQISSPQVQAGIQRLQTALSSDPSFGPGHLQVNTQGNLGLLTVPVAGDATSDTAINAVTRLRHQYIPNAFSGVQAHVLVTGATAGNMDYFHVTDQYIPIVFIFVLGLSFLFLIVVFRSLVVPLKAIIMNLLSVGAAYGLLVLVFQKGVGAGLLHFQKVEAIEAWVPLFLFSVLFGLSMDYHVFLLSRIREHFDQTGDNTESVAFGLRSTGAIITGAALIMVAVFSAFATGELVMFQQMGFGLAVAVFMDAAVVRCILVPAAMRLLGNWNWYLPSILHRLPVLRTEETESIAVPVSDEKDPPSK